MVTSFLVFFPSHRVTFCAHSSIFSIPYPNPNPHYIPIYDISSMHHWGSTSDQTIFIPSLGPYPEVIFNIILFSHTPSGFPFRALFIIILFPSIIPLISLPHNSICCPFPLVLFLFPYPFLSHYCSLYSSFPPPFSFTIVLFIPLSLPPSRSPPFLFLSPIARFCFIPIHTFFHTSHTLTKP